MTHRVKSVDDYIASKPPAVRERLERVRRAIRKGIPKAGEGISYGIPAYTLHGSTVLYFAGWTRHYSLYPAKGSLVAAFKDELARYEVGKGTIRLPLAGPVPSRLIERIARFRAREAAGRSRRTQAAPKRPRPRSHAVSV